MCSSGPKVFHREMPQPLADVLGVICDMDDALISAQKPPAAARPEKSASCRSRHPVLFRKAVRNPNLIPIQTQTFLDLCLNLM
ncbi:hypothetical protein BaRGS_00013251 [Batillaria attramentaria]|uniref:Uncharacterized protein n=1 Tax=Batillaria attramentaria TaxID=370345 RepID=A0ABD0L8Q0_9CAEN